MPDQSHFHLHRLPDWYQCVAVVGKFLSVYGQALNRAVSSFCST